MDDIQDVLEKVQGLQPLDMSKPTPLCNLAITSRECEHVFEAIEQFNHILAKNPEYLLAHVGLAHSYALEVAGRKPDWEKALSCQDIVIYQVKTGTRVFAKLDPKEHLKVLLMDKATWLRRLKRY